VFYHEFISFSLPLVSVNVTFIKPIKQPRINEIDESNCPYCCDLIWQPKGVDVFMANLCTRSAQMLFHNTQSLTIKHHIVVVVSNRMRQNIL